MAFIKFFMSSGADGLWTFVLNSAAKSCFTTSLREPVRVNWDCWMEKYNAEFLLSKFYFKKANNMRWECSTHEK